MGATCVTPKDDHSFDEVPLYPDFSYDSSAAVLPHLLRTTDMSPVQVNSSLRKAVPKKVWPNGVNEAMSPVHVIWDLEEAVHLDLEQMQCHEDDFLSPVHVGRDVMEAEHLKRWPSDGGDASLSPEHFQADPLKAMQFDGDASFSPVHNFWKAEHLNLRPAGAEDDWPIFPVPQPEELPSESSPLNSGPRCIAERSPKVSGGGRSPKFFQVSSHAQNGAPLRKSCSRHVTFLELPTVVFVQPYSEIYGRHPREFDFDEFGNHIPCETRGFRPSREYELEDLNQNMNSMFV